MSDKIQFVFGQFAVDLGDGPVLLKTEAEAQSAISDYENGAEQRQEAADYCATAHPGLAAKAVAGKSNVIVAYLQWVDAGRPAPAPVEAAADAEEDEV